MELRQLRSFVCVVESGSISRAAFELGFAQSALSQQMTRLESELSTRLLHRTPQGVAATEAGLAFYREAQLTLRHAEQAMRAAKQARLTGTVTVGLAPTTASIMGIPFLAAMRESYPDVSVHIVESLSGHLSAMLNARQLDLAILFSDRVDSRSNRRWTIQPLLEEDLFYIVAKAQELPNRPEHIKLAQLRDKPLILPSSSHGLRGALDAAFDRAKMQPKIVIELDSLSLLIDAVLVGMGGTLQPWGMLARMSHLNDKIFWTRISDKHFTRHNFLCSLSDEEMSPSSLAARVLMRKCVRDVIDTGQWIGARLNR